MILGRWTGREARALRLAMRMPMRAWAEHLGVSTRAVCGWEALGAARVPRPHMQAILDTALAKADADTQQRFRVLLDDVAADGE